MSSVLSVAKKLSATASDVLAGEDVAVETAGVLGAAVRVVHERRRRRTLAHRACDASARCVARSARRGGGAGGGAGDARRDRVDAATVCSDSGEGWGLELTRFRGRVDYAARATRSSYFCSYSFGVK